MKKIRLPIFIACFLAPWVGIAQDTIHRVEGFDWGVLPAVSYNSDLGLHYGVYGEFFFYGKDSLCTFPDFRNMIYFELSRYTGGQMLAFLQYESKCLIPNTHFSSVLSYQLDPLYNFYGFNGYAEPYEYKRDRNKSDDIAFYSIKRQQFHFDATMQGVFNDFFSWMGAIAVWGLRMEDITKEPYDADNTRYRQYCNNGLIREGEKDGGTHLEFKVGCSMDTRDFEASPTRGVCVDAFFNGSPDLFKSGFSYLKFNFHFRNYLSLCTSNRFVFAYHLAYQGTMMGEVPFYLQNNINLLNMRQTSSEGLGGFNTIRGLAANRILSDGFAWGNLELRIKLFEFRLLKRQWYLATNPFFDAGIITQTYRLEEQAKLLNTATSELRRRAQTPYMSAGLGFKLVMNQNFITSFEMAKVINNTNEYYPMGYYFNLNYIF